MKNLLGVIIPILMMFSFVRYHSYIWNLFPLKFREKYWSHSLVIGCFLVVFLSIFTMYIIIVLL
jgi:hypothetical protein